MDASRKKHPWWFLPLFFLILLLHQFGDRLHSRNLFLPLVAVLFILGFGVLGCQVLKLWKQPDEEVLGVMPAAHPPIAQPTLVQRGGSFLVALYITVRILVLDKQFNWGGLIFCSIILLGAGAYFFPALIQKLRGKEGQPLFPNAVLQPMQIFFMMFGFLGVCFAVFWCYLMITKAIWWLSFPGIIIGAAFARPLVAGIRIMIRGRKIKDHGDPPPG